MSSTFSKLARKFINYREVRLTKWKAEDPRRDILSAFLGDLKGSKGKLGKLENCIISDQKAGSC